MEPHYRDFLPDDLPDLARVFREAFGGELSVPEWTWKYVGSPFHGASVVAVVDGRPEGFYGAWATRYRGAAGDLPGVAAVDVMTSRAARVLGRHVVFRDLALKFSARNRDLGAPFYFGFPNDRHRTMGEKLLDYVEVERCGEWEATALPARRKSLLSRAVRGKRFGVPHASLAEALHGRAGWRSDRSARTLNWRFFDRPGAAYDVVQLLSLSGRSRGYAVVKTEGPVGRIVDLQVRDESGGDLPDLLAALATTGAVAAASPVDRWILRTPRHGVLADRLSGELGFTERASDCSFTVRRLVDGFEVLEAARAFDYRFCDHDVF